MYRWLNRNFLLQKRCINCFSTFYHPCKIKLPIDQMRSRACVMSYYINVYRQYGHFYAKLDPLNLYNKQFKSFVRPTDLGILFTDNLESFKGRKGFIAQKAQNVEQLEQLLQQVYLQSVGVQFSHINMPEEKDWLYQNYEQIMLTPLKNKVKVQLAKTLIQSEAFDHFLHKKFVTFKRYSGEGAQSTVVALEQLFQFAVENNFQHIVLGMPHRGRLNVLVNIMDYQPQNIFRKISGKTDTPEELRDVIDDVTSHISQSVVKQINGKKLKVTMVHNPSHLEAQNPVSMGKTRSKQNTYGQENVLNIQIHGDAAFCAQGVVYESLCLSKVPNYNINGTIHLITNNQIGYTTKPIDGRPSKYCSDIGKAFDIPIIHVNSQKIEQVYRVIKLCANYQLKYKKDILIDLVCYRKFGHNEVDEPQFTQPKMYEAIRKDIVPNTKQYPLKLQELGIFLKEQTPKIRQIFLNSMQKQFDLSLKQKNISLKDYLDSNRVGGARAFTEFWSSFKPSQYGQEYKTGFDIEMLDQFARASVYYPAQFNIHPRIKKYHMDERIKSLDTNLLNWATCEAIALFSLNYQGYNIRMTGQDVERGTFSQRHANFIDQKTQQSFNPLNFFAKQLPGRGLVQIFNSPLSQNAALSYEYGFSIDNPNNLVIWEAQFGDFYNTAQVVVDVFLTNSENKWLRQTGIILNLPHGFDGAGPQHSSCRIQRFLQSANSDGSIIQRSKKENLKGKKLNLDDNFFYQSIQSANFSLIIPTKPANIFHAIRRQMKRNFRKPLIIAGPKTLLRLAACVSKIEDLSPDKKFQRILPYANSHNIQNCRVMLLCSGKFVYNIQSILKKNKSTDVCLYTIEQLFPFPEQQLQLILQKLPKDAHIYWVQQQNLNGGGYDFCSKRIIRVMNTIRFKHNLQYVGRRAIAATAVGSSDLFKQQQQQLLEWVQKIIKQRSIEENCFES